MSSGVAYRAGALFLAGGIPGRAHPRIVRWRERFYSWSGSCYVPTADEEVMSQVTHWLVRTPGARTDRGGTEREVTQSLLRDVMLAVRTESHLDAHVQASTWIGPSPTGTLGPWLATPSSIIDLGRVGDAAARPLPSDHQFFALSALPVDPDLSATHPVWDQFLEETFRRHAEGPALLQELFHRSVDRCSSGGCRSC